jgi:hypothetical protein
VVAAVAAVAVGEVVFYAGKFLCVSEFCKKKLVSILIQT